MWAILGNTLLSIAGSVALRMAVALGIGSVSYVGVNTSLSWMRDQAVEKFATLPTEVLAVIGLLKVGVCISMVFSAILARMTLQGLTSDTFRNFVKR